MRTDRATADLNPDILSDIWPTCSTMTDGKRVQVITKSTEQSSREANSRSDSQ
jgi:hypothetical protein